MIRADVERAAGAANGNGGRARRRRPAVAATRLGSAKGEATRHELTTIQRTVARRMAESRATVPDIELRSEVDMTAAVALREQLRALPDLVSALAQ